jgi:hypothetical protein
MQLCEKQIESNIRRLVADALSYERAWQKDMPDLS